MMEWETHQQVPSCETLVWGWGDWGLWLTADAPLHLCRRVTMSPLTLYLLSWGGSSITGHYKEKDGNRVGVGKRERDEGHARLDLFKRRQSTHSSNMLESDYHILIRSAHPTQITSDMRLTTRISIDGVTRSCFIASYAERREIDTCLSEKRFISFANIERRRPGSDYKTHRHTPQIILTERDSDAIGRREKPEKKSASRFWVNSPRFHNLSFSNIYISSLSPGKHLNMVGHHIWKMEYIQL